MGEALHNCSTSSSRLISFKDCAELETLREELITNEYEQYQEFFVGVFAHGLTQSKESRRFDGNVDAAIDS